jgi:hypothetical protein
MLSFTDRYYTVRVYVVIHWPLLYSPCLCCHSLTVIIQFVFMLSFTDRYYTVRVYVVIHWPLLYSPCLCCHSLTIIIQSVFMLSFLFVIVCGPFRFFNYHIAYKAQRQIIKCIQNDTFLSVITRYRVIMKHLFNICILYWNKQIPQSINTLCYVN